MNIISNTCLGAYLYKQYKTPYTNPFCWNIIDYDSMYRLIKNYKSMNFGNISVMEKEKNNYASLVIDDCVNVEFVHYKDRKYKEEIESTKPNDNNLYLPDCVDYTRKKYIERLKRMTGTPVFVLHVQSKHPVTGDIGALEQILNLDTQYKIIIISSYPIKSKRKNIINIVQDESIINIPSVVAKTCYKKIKNFL